VLLGSLFVVVVPLLSFICASIGVGKALWDASSISGWLRMLFVLWTNETGSSVNLVGSSRGQVVRMFNRWLWPHIDKEQQLKSCQLIMHVRLHVPGNTFAGTLENGWFESTLPIEVKTFVDNTTFSFESTS
jgi:hypothetical protein